jgi:hypothetical protein
VAVRLSYHRAEPARLEDVYLKYLEGNGGPLGTWSDGNGKGEGAAGGDNSATCKTHAALVAPTPAGAGG